MLTTSTPDGAPKLQSFPLNPACRRHGVEPYQVVIRLGLRAAKWTALALCSLGLIKLMPG